jgi:lipooligosaccharide transport system permease protein
MRAFEYWLYRYRRTWRGSIAYSFIFPTLYLAAMGLGLGTLVNKHLGTSISTIGATAYLPFVAPGILAGSAMQIAVNESTYPVMGAIRWDRSYLSQTYTPLSVSDVLIGHVCFMAFRLLITCVAFCLIMCAFGAMHSWQGILAVPACLLTGLAFALPLAAFSARQETDAGVSTVNRLIVVPLFLFSGSFFPTHQLPKLLRVVALATPLYHGVALARSCTLGHLVQWASVAHLLYLLGLLGVGVLVARASYRKRLIS